MGSEVEQTLFRCPEVDVFKIPPRPAAGGVRSGEWRLSDRIFAGRLRVVGAGERLEVRLEDSLSSELFGVCPVPRGQRGVAVESANDSSRNFVLRLEDAQAGRHAFVGLSFADRAAAFDFNVSLSDWEKQLAREAEVDRIRAAPGDRAAAAAAGSLPEAASLYKQHDLKLKEGETIKIAMKIKDPSASPSMSGGTGFLSRMGAAGAASPAGSLVSLAPPPPAPAPVASASAAAATPQRLSNGGNSDLLGVADTAAAFDAFQPYAAAPTTSAAAPAEENAGWATFD